MAMAFIVGGVIGSLFGAALVYMYELRVMRDFGRRVDDIEKSYLRLLNEYPPVDYQKFADEVIDMLMLFCDDDDQISLKVCELKANMQSILQEFVPTFPEGVPVCKELRGKGDTHD